MTDASRDRWGVATATCDQPHRISVWRRGANGTPRVVFGNIEPEVVTPERVAEVLAAMHQRLNEVAA